MVFNDDDLQFQKFIGNDHLKLKSLQSYLSEKFNKFEELLQVLFLSGNLLNERKELLSNENIASHSFAKVDIKYLLGKFI